MKLWLVSSLNSSQSTGLVFEASEELGWEVAHLSPPKTTYNLSASTDDVLCQSLFPSLGREKPDLCLIRMGSSAPAHNLALPMKLASLGIPCINNPRILMVNRDKAWAAVQLSAHGIPTPKSISVPETYSFETVCSEIPEGPWILKSRYGLKGLGVMLVESKRSLRSAIDSLLLSHTEIIVQECITENIGQDVRVLVVGDTAVAAMTRKGGSPDDFRSNLYLGGSGTEIPVTDEIASIATQAAKSVGLTLAGVDLLGSPGQYRVVEVNSSPGFGGLSRALGRNIALEILPLLKILSESAKKGL